MERSIERLAQAIERLAASLSKNNDLGAVEVESIDHKTTKPQCMDAAGKPTSFKRRCGICGELGRYRSSHRDEMKDGTYHWVEVSE